MIISLLMTIILAAISMGMMKTDDVLEKVGGATYKTDNMVVVVKKGDSAKDIEDAEDYRFGYQTAVDQKNTDKMIKDIEKKVGKDVKTEEYESLTDEANALLNGNVDAAVFNEGYMSMIDESVEGFSEKVKILYQYGVKTEVKKEKNVDVTEPFNVYISGIDVDGPITTNSRSDVNLIMTGESTDEKNITDNNAERLLCDDTGSIRRRRETSLHMQVSMEWTDPWQH